MVGGLSRCKDATKLSYIMQETARIAKFLVSVNMKLPTQQAHQSSSSVQEWELAYILHRC